MEVTPTDQQPGHVPVIRLNPALANHGTDTRLIQDFLGHASISNTVRYTKLAPGRLAMVRVR